MQKTIIYITFIVLVYSCKTTKTDSRTKKGQEAHYFNNSLNISLNSSNTKYAIDKNISNKLCEELIFKDIAPSYYLNKESIFNIPQNIEAIKTKAAFDTYHYFFDTSGKLDSLFTTRNGSYKVYYNAKNGLIDYIKNTIPFDNSTKIRITKYLTYFCLEQNKITKYISEKKDLELEASKFEAKFTFNNQGEIIKTNYGIPLEKNYIEYYSFAKDNAKIRLMKSQAGRYFFINGYKIDHYGKIEYAFFTNTDTDLNSSNTDFEKIRADYELAFKTQFDIYNRLISIENEEIKHSFEYYNE